MSNDDRARDPTGPRSALRAIALVGGRLASYHPGRARAVLLPMRVAPFAKLVAS